jgi:hypothetical protein
VSELEIGGEVGNLMGFDGHVRCLWVPWENRDLTGLLEVW